MHLILVLEVEPIIQRTYRDWPLHCTLVHWFDFNGELQDLENMLAELYKSHAAVTLRAGEKAMFGINHDVEVNLIEKTAALELLHQASIDGLRRIGAKFTAEQFLGSGYRPHVTVQNARCLAPGEAHQSTSVYLIKLVSEEPRERKVIKQFVLTG